MANLPKCPNCHHLITCGCQVKHASDGKQVCTMCMAAYEKSLKLKNLIKPKP